MHIGVHVGRRRKLQKPAIWNHFEKYKNISIQLLKLQTFLIKFCLHDSLYFSDRQSTESIYKFSINCIDIQYQNVNRVVAAGNKKSGHTHSSTNPEHPVEGPESPKGWEYPYKLDNLEYILNMVMGPISKGFVCMIKMIKWILRRHHTILKEYVFYLKGGILIRNT